MKNKHTLTGTAALERMGKLSDLGIKTIPLNKYSSNIKRWFDEGEIIQFTDYTESTDIINAKYEISSKNNHEIWLSQLANLFFTLENDELIGYTTITLNGQEPLEINPFCSHSDFWDIVKNKKFKVSVCDLCKVSMNMNSDKFWDIIGPDFEINKFVDFYQNAIATKNYKSLNGLVKSAKCYDLIEI